MIFLPPPHRTKTQKQLIIKLLLTTNRLIFKNILRQRKILSKTGLPFGNINKTGPFTDSSPANSQNQPLYCLLPNRRFYLWRKPKFLRAF